VSQRSLLAGLDHHKALAVVRNIVLRRIRPRPAFPVSPFEQESRLSCAKRELLCDVDNHEPVFIPVEQLLTVAGPYWLDAPLGRYLPFLARPREGLYVDLVPTRLIRLVRLKGDPAAIGGERPLRLVEPGGEERLGLAVNIGPNNNMSNPVSGCS